jgi:hypothetical protein
VTLRHVSVGLSWPPSLLPPQVGALPQVCGQEIFIDVNPA